MSIYLFLEAIVQNTKNDLKWFDIHNGFIMAVATVVLVIVTARSIKEAKNTRMDNRLPIIKPKIEGPINFRMPSQLMRFEMENIGYGLALDVKLNFIFNKVEEINFGNIEVGIEEGVSIEFTEDKLNQMKKATKLLDVVVISYEDIFGRRITTFASIIDENENSTNDWPVLTVSKWRVNLPE